VLGHVVLLVSQLSFLLASTVFSFVFFTQNWGRRCRPAATR